MLLVASSRAPSAAHPAAIGGVRQEPPPDDEPPTGEAQVSDLKPGPKDGSPSTNGPVPTPPEGDYTTDFQGLTVDVSYYGYRWYDPFTGRWPSRDPINDKGFWATAGKTENLKGLVTEKLIERLKSAGNRRTQIAAQRQLTAWIEGQVESSEMAENLGLMKSLDYTFVENDPINSIDKFGLDREIQGGIHSYLVLEDWKDVGGKWVSQGATEWNFGPANYFLSVGSVTLLAPVPGIVWTYAGGFQNPFKSTPCQDIVAKAKLAQAAAKPPWYSFLGFNCRDFAQVHLTAGMNDPHYKEGKCCNLDGTVWKR